MLEQGDDLPPSLAEAAFMWRDEPRRFPALLTLKRNGAVTPYIGVLPLDSPPLGQRRIEEADLDGLLLATPMHHHRCAACGARFAVLYADHGVPTPGDARGRHSTFSGCPACGADVGASRLTGLAFYRR